MPVIATPLRPAHYAYWFYRTPDDDPLPDLLATLDTVQRQVLVIAYGFTLAPVVDRLIALYEGGADVRLILDSSQAAGVAERAQVTRLKVAGVPHVVGRSSKGGIIHLKTMVFDGSLVWTGSWNMSASASKQDNDVLIFRSESMATEYIALFESEWIRLKGAVIPPKE